MKCNPTNKKIVALVFPGRQEKNFEIFTPKFLCIAMASFTPTKGPRWDIETMKWVNDFCLFQYKRNCLLINYKNIVMHLDDHLRLMGLKVLQVLILGESDQIWKKRIVVVFVYGNKIEIVQTKRDGA